MSERRMLSHPSPMHGSAAPKAMVTMAEDFDVPLEDLNEYMP